MNALHTLPDLSPISEPGALSHFPSRRDRQPALQRATRTGNTAGPQLGVGKLAHRRLRVGGNLFWIWDPDGAGWWEERGVRQDKKVL